MTYALLLAPPWLWNARGAWDDGNPAAAVLCILAAYAGIASGPVRVEPIRARLFALHVLLCVAAIAANVWSRP